MILQQYMLEKFRKALALPEYFTNIYEIEQFSGSCM